MGWAAGTHQLAEAAHGSHLLRDGAQLVVTGDEDGEGQAAQVGGQGAQEVAAVEIKGTGKT